MKALVTGVDMRPGVPSWLNFIKRFCDTRPFGVFGLLTWLLDSIMMEWKYIKGLMNAANACRESSEIYCP